MAEQDDVGVLIVSSDASRPEWHASPAVNMTVARIAVEIQESYGKPVVMLNNLDAKVRPEILEILDPAGITAVQGTDHGLRAVRHWIDFHTREPYAEALVQPPPEVTSLANSVLQGRRGVLSETECKTVFKAAGISPPLEVVVPAGVDLREAARKVGYPLVLKAVSRFIAHKSELGLVRTGISSPDQLASVHAEMLRRLEGLSYEGFLVSEQVTAHREVILGLQRDPQFGMTVVIGAGGVMAEALDDAAVALLPVDEETAWRMIDGLRVRQTFGEWRGAPPADLQALCAAIVNMGNLASAFGDRLVSAEINPLAVLPAGGGVRALDGLMVLDTD
jgi:acyl-CoA synthetase (NDP forming)